MKKKIFASKNHKKIVLYTIIICVFIVIVSTFINIKEIDIYGHKMLIFIKGRGSAYLLNPITIKTEFGSIYLKRFANIGRPYIFSDVDTRTRYDWDEIELSVYTDKDIVCDLNLFGQKLEVKYPLIKLTARSTISVRGIGQPIIVNGKKEILEDFYYFTSGSNEVLLTLRSAPTFNMTTTLNGEVLEINSGW